MSGETRGGAREKQSSTGWIGLSTARPAAGALRITSVTPGSPAANAGLQIGDVITKLDHKPVGDLNFRDEIAGSKPGSNITIGYMRGAWGLETTVLVGMDPQ